MLFFFVRLVFFVLIIMVKMVIVEEMCIIIHLFIVSLLIESLEFQCDILLLLYLTILSLKDFLF